MKSLGALCTFFFICFFILCSSKSQASAWVKDSNVFYSELSFGYFQAENIFSSTGKRVDNELLLNPLFPSSALFGLIDATYKQWDLNAYLEYGLGADFELSLNLPLQIWAQQDAENGTFTTSGVGDAIAGLKYMWMDLPALTSAVQLDIGLPLANDGATASSDGVPDQIIPLGDGEFDYALRLLVSRSFYPVPIYLNADIGYRFRGKSNGVNFFDDLPWSAETGVTAGLAKGKNVFRNVTFFSGLQGLISTKDEIGITNLGATPTGAVPGQAFTTLYGGVFLHLYKGFSLVTNASYVLSGKNTGAGYGVRAGIAYEGKL